MHTVIYYLSGVGIALFVYIVPGLALLVWLWPDRTLTWPEYIGLAAGVSISLYPLLFLWAYAFGTAPGALIAIAPGILGSAALLLRYRTAIAQPVRSIKTVLSSGSKEEVVHSLLFVSLIGVLLFTRLQPVRSMTAPAWGDSVQHTFIVQLLLDNNGLFQSWNPYAPMQSMAYHYGFHSLMAVWAWLSGTSAPQAMIVGGQILNVLAVVVLYPLAVRLTSGNRWAGLAAVLVTGILSTLPAFYVNWGRYTQLAGQIILMVVLWMLDAWWSDEERPGKSMVVVLLLLLAGLALTHYRVALVAAAAVAGWSLWGLWQHRRELSEWVSRTVLFGGVSVLAVACIAPWVSIVATSRLATVQTTIAEQSVSNAAFWQELHVWRDISTYYPRALWMSSIGIALLALWKCRQLIVPLALWSVLAFFLTNPFLLFLPGTGSITNFALLVGLYIPIGLLIGWAIGEVWAYLSGIRFGYVVIVGSVLLLTSGGVRQQLHVVDPFYQMMTPADRQAFEWIDENVSSNANFLVNGFLAYNNTSVVGSDAGWWLPLYTQRQNTIPPLLYMTERLPSSEYRDQIRQLVVNVREKGNDPAELTQILCQADVTHIYLGQKRGRVGFNQGPLIQESWLAQNRNVSLIYHTDKAQVWTFDRTSCKQQ